MKLVSVHIPEAYLRGLEALVKAGYYPNRAEAIRSAVRDLLMREAWRKHSESGEPVE